MGAGKNKTHRKKRISKHVLESQKQRKEAEEQQQHQQQNEPTNHTNTNPLTIQSNTHTNTNTTNEESSTKKHKKSSKNHHIKDPNEAQAYLSAWNHHRESNTASWKFNKNTQSWLFRHMYDSNKVQKSTFDILLRYMSFLKGNDMRKRIQQDAIRRALRYKEWEQRHQKNVGTNDDANDGTSNEKEQQQQQTDTDLINNVQSDSKEAKIDTTTKDEELLDEEKIWLALSDHDKRKEYKRARKVVDLFKE
jgi:hypothetical protein